MWKESFPLFVNLFNIEKLKKSSKFNKVALTLTVRSYTRSGFTHSEFLYLIAVSLPSSSFVP
jgi:hypothetical protein